MYATHVLFAEAIAYPLSRFFTSTGMANQNETFLFLAGVLIGALLPDIDEPKSFIGRIFLPVSLVVSRFASHRGITHNIYGIAIVVFLSMLFFFSVYIYADSREVQRFLAAAFLGLFLGYVLHIMGDSMTISGIKNFCCKRTLFTVPKILRFKTGSAKENFFMIFFITVLMAEIYYL